MLLTRSHRRYPLTWILLGMIWCFCQVVPVLPKEENLYKILGVRRNASTKDIKKAYRRKALESHPDKNRDVPPEQAADEFQRVVHAFEILSDNNARRIYDRTGQTNTGRPGSGGTGGSHSFHWNSKPGPRKTTRPQGPKRTPLKDQFKVQEAMSRVLHVTSLRQLKTIMLKDEEVNITKTETVLEEKEEEIIVANETMLITRSVNVTKITTIKTTIEHETVDRHLLMVFTTPGRVEKIVDEELVFPYPYAALSPQGIWWEEFLQTVKVRFYDPTKLTRYFDIPHRSNMGVPVFIFVKKGSTLLDYKKLATARRDKFTNWVWNLLQVEVQFINRHDRDVDIWWVHDEQIKYQSTLQPNHVSVTTSKLSHTFWVRDSRVNKHLPEEQKQRLKKDQLLSDNSTIQVIDIVSGDKDQRFEIDIKGCMDLSTTCDEWWDDGNCTQEDRWSLSYTSKYCRKTCGKCTAADDFKAKKEHHQCKDHEGSCRIWARQGECKRNEMFMLMQCPYSCKLCDPRDDDENTKKKQGGEETKAKKKTRKKNRKKEEHSGDDAEDMEFEDVDFEDELWEFDSGDLLDSDSDEEDSEDEDLVFDSDDEEFDFVYDSDDEEFDFVYSSDSSDDEDQGHDEL